ncbi:MAG: hypothetical protein F7C38_02385 [Desulfurococcales archaeon]|nr:hypothetical protein [Desulfurococcales archaeon]
MLAIYSLPSVITWMACGLLQRLKAKYREKRWNVQLLEHLFLSNSCNNIGGDGHEQLDKIGLLIVLVLLVIFTLSIVLSTVPLLLEYIFINQAGAASSQALSGIIALTIAVVYTVPFTLLSITHAEAVMAAYDVLLSTALIFDVLEIFTYLAIFGVMRLWILTFLVIITIFYYATC